MTAPTWTANTLSAVETGLYYETTTSNPWPAIVTREYPLPNTSAIGNPVELVVFFNGAIGFRSATRQSTTPTIAHSFIAIP